MKKSPKKKPWESSYPKTPDITLLHSCVIEFNDGERYNEFQEWCRETFNGLFRLKKVKDKDKEEPLVRILREPPSTPPSFTSMFFISINDFWFLKFQYRLLVKKESDITMVKMIWG